MSTNSASSPGAIAVYCASSIGKHPAYAAAARSLGRALVSANRGLVYGGGTMGLMGVVSQTVLDGGGKVTGVVPFAMVAAGGERSQSEATRPPLVLSDTEQSTSIVVSSMHERKVEMAKRSEGFISLPGGFGTLEELLEVTTWTQLGIHRKPVVLLNVLSYYNPLRELIQNALQAGFIAPENADLITFVDGPDSLEEHETFDWGKAGLNGLAIWEAGGIRKTLYDWSVMAENSVVDPLKAT